MSYYLNLFSPETYTAFTESNRTISGFRIRQQKKAKQIKPGDRFVCYMTKFSRWIGVLEVVRGPFVDETPIFLEDDDPFVVRFEVKPVVWLPKEQTIPIHEPEVWNRLSFTKDCEPGTSQWTGKVRSSLNELSEEDGAFLEELLLSHAEEGREYEINESHWQRHATHSVRRADRVVSVTVPGEEDEEEGAGTGTTDSGGMVEEVRESIRIQALLARIGSTMGYDIWAPRGDKGRIEQALGEESIDFLEILPLNYDDTTLKTIEQIDLLWLSGRAIIRAFEVEHTTSVYSGILRMADLLALQPNMDIRLHIVAPEERKEKVFTEIRRPVFSLLDRGPLAEYCTYLTYDAVRELAAEPKLAYMSEGVLEMYEEEAE